MQKDLLRKIDYYLALIVMGFLVLFSLIEGHWGQIGPDSDDALRLVQVRDLIAGQNWFDLTQYRMGAEGGTAMHWSRLVDLPIYILIKFFDIFVSYEMAENLAMAIWPILCGGTLFLALAWGVRHHYGSRAVIFLLIILVAWLKDMPRFKMGALDHHNLQMVMVAFAVAGLLSRPTNMRAYAVSGVCAALSVAIGAEVYIFVGIICLFPALYWLFKGAELRRSVMAFGFALGATLLSVFILTVPPSQYMASYCDSLSFVTVGAAAFGGFGLAIGAMSVRQGSFKIRLAVLAILGLTCAVFFLRVAPQCLSNPLSDLPEIMHVLWLDHITEAKSLLAPDPNRWEFFFYTLGPAFIACLACIFSLRQTERRAQHLFLLSLILVSVMVSFYQLRFIIFTHIFGFFAVACWVARLYDNKAEDSQAPRYLFVLALSFPVVWLVPSALLSSSEDEQAVQKDQTANACYSAELMQGLNTLPKGRIMMPTNGAREILTQTSHHILGGNYHRNIIGVTDTIYFYTGSKEQALTIIQKHGIDYIHICRSSGELARLTRYSDDSFAARLKAGEPVDFFDVIFESEDGENVIYDVRATPAKH